MTATLKHGDGRTEEVRTPYLVGCDGARSFVRQTLGIDFDGYTEPETFLLGDVLIDGGNLDHRLHLSVVARRRHDRAVSVRRECVAHLRGARE